MNALSGWAVVALHAASWALGFAVGRLYERDTALKRAREVCICAAIRLPDGRIFRGHRHSDCLKAAHERVAWNGGFDPGDHHWPVNACDDQGFITSRGRYVDREEGLRLQRAAGIPSACPSGYRARELFSEDLY